MASNTLKYTGFEDLETEHTFEGNMAYFWRQINPYCIGDEGYVIWKLIMNGSRPTWPLP